MTRFWHRYLDACAGLSADRMQVSRPFVVTREELHEVASRLATALDACSRDANLAARAQS